MTGEIFLKLNMPFDKIQSRVKIFENLKTFDMSFNKIPQINWFDDK